MRGGTAIDVAVDLAGTWTNQMLMHVMFLLVGKGATWPSHGLPRGTPSLVYGFVQNMVMLPGFELLTSRQGNELTKSG
jgi:hypothetical protein